MKKVFQLKLATLLIRRCEKLRLYFNHWTNCI